MYKITNMPTIPQKMQHILKELTTLRYQQLEHKDLEVIYITLTKLIDIKNYQSDLSTDILKTLFIINHYYQINNSHKLLLKSLHLCKLNTLDNEYTKSKIDECINIAGNFEINSILTQSITNTFLLADFYFQLTNSNNISENIFLDFIKTSINSNEFNTTSFCLSIDVCMDECGEYADGAWLNRFTTLKVLLNNRDNYQNYSNFIKWYIK